MIKISSLIIDDFDHRPKSCLWTKRTKKKSLLEKRLAFVIHVVGLNAFSFLTLTNGQFQIIEKVGAPHIQKLKKRGPASKIIFVRPAGFWPKNTVGPLP